MTTQSTITENAKFTVTGQLDGQAGRKFISGTEGIVTQIKTVMAGTKYETTTIMFKMQKNSMNFEFGGVCELQKFMSNVSIN